ncbi:MAG: hypothetical protein H6977_14725 [Gammaproteobacteria bacterium]|nr:hypothetical protein [Gammaproteobacteria bacterium]MCP5201263.1 hypothetical protein [Gammaproteobacteria bacterium]
MADQKILAKLAELKRDSGMRIPDHLITGMTRSLTQARHQLIRSRVRTSGPGFAYEPTNGAESLSIRANTAARRKLMSLATGGGEDTFLHTLNSELLGGNSYPILDAVLGATAGAVAVGAGYVFTIVSTALNLSKTSHRVLARPGDELWQVEEIGKQDSSVVHVGSYFLVDPYRSQGASGFKGWLIHEQRTELDI